LVRFDKQFLSEGFQRNLSQAAKNYSMTTEEREQLTQLYEKCFHNYTYLE
jgi:arginine decarboxylase-like protein